MALTTFYIFIKFFFPYLVIYIIIYILTPKQRKAVSFHSQAQKYFDRKNYNEALIYIDRAFAIKSNYVFWRFRSCCLLELARYEEALDSCARCTSDFHLGFGYCIPESRWSKYSNILHFLCASNESYYQLRSYILLQLERYHEALDSLDIAIERYRKSWFSWGERSLILGNLERYEEALDSINLAIKYRKRHPDLWRIKGCVLNSLKDYEAAIAAFERAIKLQRINSKINKNMQTRLEAVFYFKGYALSKLKRYEEAKNNYHFSIELNSNYIEPFLNLASDYACQGNIEEALKYLQQAIEIEPEYCSKYLSEETSYDCLREDTRFQELQKLIEKIDLLYFYFLDRLDFKYLWECSMNLP